MNALDEVLKRVDDVVARLERTDASKAPTPTASTSTADLEALTRRVDTALAKARAARSALD